MVAASAAETMGMIKPLGIGEERRIMVDRRMIVVDRANSQTEREKVKCLGF